jgi:CheY-like chemotaxis protein
MPHHEIEVPVAPRSLRVLVVEDNLLIAETLCDLLTDRGCSVVGPVPDLPRSMAMIDSDRPDAVLLDINLGGTLSFPLAGLLDERGVPFVFLTGYDEGVLFPAEFRGVRRISKPFDAKDVTEVLEVWRRMVRA